MRPEFRGTGVALVTPFKANDKGYPDMDFDAYARLIEHVIEGKVEYVVVNGTTGETVTLTREEQVKILEFAVERVKGRVPVVAGVGGNNTAEVIRFLKEFHFKGISAVLSVSPYYNKPTQEGIYRHYMMLADASPLPILLYNVPGRTAANISAETSLRLAHESEKIIGIKEASGNIEQCMRIIREKPAGFLVLSGDDALTLPLIACGMDGVISVIANAYPKDFSEMVRLALKNDFPAARRLHYQLLEIMQLLFVEGNPAGIKCVLDILGICNNVLRLPLTPVSNATAVALIKAIREYKQKEKVKV